MQIILYIVGGVWIAFGACMILYTTESRRFVQHLVSPGRDRRILAVLAFIGSLLLITASGQSSHQWVIVLLGVIGIIKGAVIYLNPKRLYEFWTDWFLNRARDQTFRLIGIISVVLGTAMLSWVK